ncbi:MAG: anthranilate synthase component I family protein [Verrucomicrobiales bacterium]
MQSPLPVQPSLETFLEQSVDYNHIPLVVELMNDTITPLAAFEYLVGPGPGFLLESAVSTDVVGHYSFVGWNATHRLTSLQGVVTVREQGLPERRFEHADPLAVLEELLSKFKSPEVPELEAAPGGAVGYLGFDMVRVFEPTAGAAPAASLGLPELDFLLAQDLLIFDHRQQRLKLVSFVHCGEGMDFQEAYRAGCIRLEEMLRRLRQIPSLPPLLHPPPRPGQQESFEAASNTTHQQFVDMVSKSKEHIAAGDVFQVVLSQRFALPFSGRPAELYRALRFVNPSPYLFCLQFGDDMALVGSSPEVHVRMNREREVSVRPIAGTRKRGHTPEEDQALIEDLLADPKERAEHVMLVDLGRNDLGRVVDFDSIVVEDFMSIERYSHVLHIVTNVRGRLRKDRNAFDVMRATFPAGTVSGAPKVRAMQIIHDLEQANRGPYAGTVAIFGFDGTLDSCITLRSVVLHQGQAYFQAGAGVVADSDPESEFQETINKASAMHRAVHLARTQTGSGRDSD